MSDCNYRLTSQLEERTFQTTHVYRGNLGRDGVTYTGTQTVLLQRTRPRVSVFVHLRHVHHS